MALNLLKNVIREIGVIKRMLRRKYYIYFRPDYVDRQIKERKGSCAQHGCCDLSILHRIYNGFYRRCLSEKNNRTVCRRWRSLPKECQIYPLDEKDKIPETRAYCSFHW
jgi:hypothetical protein